MLCTECGGTVVTRILAEIRPDQSRVWFWTLRCGQCGRLVDAGLRPDAPSGASSWVHPFSKPPLTN